MSDFVGNEQLRGRLGMNELVQGRTVHLSIPARPEFITLSRLALAGLCRVRPFPEETLADLKLAITEACSNSVRHAYDEGGGTIQILYRLEGDRIEIEVSDDGVGFDHSGVGGLPDEVELSEGGLGIAIIRSVADDLEFTSGEDGRGSRLRFVKSLT
jgi:serine/threonine-protein kinase RsbW